MYFRNTKQRETEVMVIDWTEGRKDRKRSNMNARNLETHETIDTDGGKRDFLIIMYNTMNDGL